MTDVLVGYPVRSRCPDGDAVGEDEEGRGVRLVRIAQGDHRAEAALEAWLRAHGEHVQGVVDLGTAPNGDLVAVVPEVPVALVDLLAVAPLDAGEALTVLIPLAEALSALHAAGAAHGAIGAPAVGLTTSGSPVLLMPRTAALAEAGPDDPRSADRRAFIALARLLLPPPLPAQLLAALEADTGGLAVDLLFALADPAPVLLDRAGGGSGAHSGMPGRLVAPAEAPRGGAVVPAGRDGSLGAPGALRALRRRIRSGVREVRARMWIAAGTALAAFAAALVLLPGHGAVRVDPAPASAPHSALVRPATPRTTAPAPASTARPPTPAAPSGHATDPVQAAAALLAARDGCLEQGSSRCLVAVDAPGSPVDGADRAALTAGVDGVRPPRARPVLLRASGSTAVLAVGPDTVLEIREALGWRLRDVIAPTPAPAQMPSEPSKSPSSSRARTAERKRAASAPSTIRWS